MNDESNPPAEGWKFSEADFEDRDGILFYRGPVPFEQLPFPFFRRHVAFLVRMSGEGCRKNQANSPKRGWLKPCYLAESSWKRIRRNRSLPLGQSLSYSAVIFDAST